MKKLKSLFYLLKNDKKHSFKKALLRKPIYLLYFLKSFSTHPVYQEKLFLFGLKNLKDLEKELQQKNVLFLGFSYCQRPKNCPQPRFSTLCSYNLKNPACQTCFIGSCKKILSKTTSSPTYLMIIPTVHLLGKKLLHLRSKYPTIPLIFLITSCFFSIKAFQDFATILNIQGAALPLSGTICNQWNEFLQAEQGKKESFTFLSPTLSRKLLQLLTIKIAKK